MKVCADSKGEHRAIAIAKTTAALRFIFPKSDFTLVRTGIRHPELPHNDSAYSKNERASGVELGWTLRDPFTGIQRSNAASVVLLCNHFNKYREYLPKSEFFDSYRR